MIWVYEFHPVGYPYLSFCLFAHFPFLVNLQYDNMLNFLSIKTLFLLYEQNEMMIFTI